MQFRTGTVASPREGQACRQNWRQLVKTHRLTHGLDRETMQAVGDRHSGAGFTTLKLNVTASRQCSVINWPLGSVSGCVILKNRSGSGTEPYYFVKDCKKFLEKS
jgi:hypothetical protein